jgi:hypothetical protein
VNDCAVETQRAAEAIVAAATKPGPSTGGVCVVSELSPGARVVRVTGIGGSPDPLPVFAWSQTFDDRITAQGSSLVGRRVFVIVADRQPFIVDLVVSAPTSSVGG